MLVIVWANVPSNEHTHSARGLTHSSIMSTLEQIAHATGALGSTPIGSSPLSRRWPGNQIGVIYGQSTLWSK